MNPWALCNNISISRVCEAFYDNMVIAVNHLDGPLRSPQRAVLLWNIGPPKDLLSTNTK